MSYWPARLDVVATSVLKFLCFCLDFLGTALLFFRVGAELLLQLLIAWNCRQQFSKIGVHRRARILRLEVCPLIRSLRLDQHFFGVRPVSQHRGQRQQHCHNSHGQSNSLVR